MQLFVPLCAMGFVGSMAASSAAQTQTKPNIVYILRDDLGYGDIRAFNPERGVRCRTPPPLSDAPLGPAAPPVWLQSNPWAARGPRLACE